MTLLTKERTIEFSAEAREAIRQMSQEARKRDEEIKSLTPPCPDGSGETGKYDPEASRYFGVTVYSTPSRKYFRWNDLDRRGRVIPPEYIPQRLR